MNTPPNTHMISPELGVCYYPEHWPESSWIETADNMFNLGLKLVRIGEFAWSRLEPKPGQYDFGWMDKAINILGQAGLKIILGTPSATPPRWMIDKYPDMLALDKHGLPRNFGSRRHYCFSHKNYRAEAAQMTARLAEHYADNPYIHSWQIDNEYGCHDTILSYSDHAQYEFRQWLKARYTSIKKLNKTWGNIFWSMEYVKFDDINLPNLTVTEPNPSHVLDFMRFSSDQLVRFNKAQCDAVRQYCNKPLIHNYMGRITDFDHYHVGHDLDIASWDSYPLGFLEDRSDQSEDFRHQYQRQGDPDFQSFHHDLYRAVGRGRWGIMEQQPGPVNWAPYNPAPLPGMVRLWTWEAIAHGAEFVNYFRWRQAPFAQEQMHAGLRRPDGKPAMVWPEIKHVAKDIAILTPIRPRKAPIALLFDYQSDWARNIQPQGQSINYFRLVYEFYTTLRSLGQDIDIISPYEDNLNPYELIIIPGLFTLEENFQQRLNQFNGQIILGPFSDHKTTDFQHKDKSLQKLGFDIDILAVESLRPSETIPLQTQGAFKFWREFIAHAHTDITQTQDGFPAIIQHMNKTYLCGWPDQKALTNILHTNLTALDINIEILPEGLRRRSFGDYILYTNYKAEPVNYQGFDLPPASIRLINSKNNQVLIGQ